MEHFLIEKSKTMTSKIKYLFLLILCLNLPGAANSVAAQTGAGDRVLTAVGKRALRQSDINKLIEFYEWAFETGFTAEQRERFAEYTRNEFRSDASGSSKTIEDIVSTLPKILAADEAVQRETRKHFLGAFLPDARKNTDKNSQMLIGIYDAAHNDGRASSAANNSVNLDDSPAPASGNISDLTGKWVWGRSGSSTYATGGAYLGSNGSRHTYQFFANGAVEYTGIMNVMTGGCNMQVFKTMTGKARLSGNTLTVSWSPASFTRDSSCDRAGNYKKTLPAETEIFQVEFKNSGSQKQLCLTSKDETCFSPTNE